MLTALSRPATGHLRIEWERTGPPALWVCADLPRSLSAAAVRAALAARVAGRLASAREWERARPSTSSTATSTGRRSRAGSRGGLS